MRRATTAVLATAVVGLLATAASTALAAVGPAPAPTPAPPPPPSSTSKPKPNLPASSVMPAVVVLGDGLTESSFSAPDGKGFGQGLQRLYTRRADVLNRGFGGFLTEWLADPETMLPSLFPPACEARAKLAIVFLGVKDSVTEKASEAWGRPYVSPEKFESAVDRIVGAALDSGARRVVLITPPPVCDVLCSKPGTDVTSLARNTANSQRYVDALGRVAAGRDTTSPSSSSSSGKKAAAAAASDDVKVRVLDIFSAWPKDFPQDWPAKYLHEDRLHLSSAGHQRLLEDLVALLRKEMPDVAPTPFAGGQTPTEREGMLPLFWPHMDDVDMLDPQPAFEAAERRGTGGPGACVAGSGKRALMGSGGGSGGGEASGGGVVVGVGGARGLRWVTAGLGLGLGAAVAGRQ
jgi:lysophospholipase L1-like esterase